METQVIDLIYLYKQPYRNKFHFSSEFISKNDT